MAWREKQNGQQAALVFPQSAMDKALFAGFEAEIWVQPNQETTQGRIYREKQNQGKVCLVLGAGNVSSNWRGRPRYDRHAAGWRRDAYADERAHHRTAERSAHLRGLQGPDVQTLAGVRSSSESPGPPCYLHRLDWHPIQRVGECSSASTCDQAPVRTMRELFRPRN